MTSVELLQQNRTLVALVTQNLSEDQWTTIPSGHKNNILWNVGHIIVTQQLLHYRLAGQEMYVSNELVEACRNGSNPADWTTPPDVGELMHLLADLPKKLADDYHAGRLNAFRPYTTSTGISLQTIEDSIAFNQFHEGVHLGIIMSLKKRV